MPSNTRGPIAPCRVVCRRECNMNQVKTLCEASQNEQRPRGQRKQPCDGAWHSSERHSHPYSEEACDQRKILKIGEYANLRREIPDDNELKEKCQGAGEEEQQERRRANPRISNLVIG